jgi:hypothetical protein
VARMAHRLRTAKRSRSTRRLPLEILPPRHGLVRRRPVPSKLPVLKSGKVPAASGDEARYSHLAENHFERC